MCPVRPTETQWTGSCATCQYACPRTPPHVLRDPQKQSGRRELLGNSTLTARQLLQAGRKDACKQAGGDDRLRAGNMTFAECGHSEVRIGGQASVHGRSGGEESGLGGTRQGRASWWSFPAATPQDTPRPGFPIAPPKHRKITPSAGNNNSYHSMRGSRRSSELASYKNPLF